MSKRSVFTTVTPLPAGTTRETVLETLHSHVEMIDLNPLIIERHPIKPPANATPEEYHCIWYSMTDKVQYLPGGLASGSVSYNGCFHDLPNGLQTHVYAPMGLNIKGKWTLGGSLPGEPVQPVELGLGAPLTGLYLREDVDMKCNMVLTSFVKKTLKNAHAHLVDRLVMKSKIRDSHLISEKSLRTTSFINPHSSMAYTEGSADSESIYDEEIMAGSTGHAVPGFNSYALDRLQSPPLGSPGFQNQQFSGPDHAELRDKTVYDPSLIPQSLLIGVRSSSSSYQGSLSDNQHRRASYNLTISDSGRQNNGRVLSLQNLPASKHSPQSQGMDSTSSSSGVRDRRRSFQPAHPYAAELHSDREFGRGMAQDLSLPSSVRPRTHGVHELE